MKYYYQYDICAFFITTVLFIIYRMRARYLSQSNKLFLGLIICDGLASLFDAISCFTISFPTLCPLVVNYIFSLGYLFFYNMMAILYFMYIYMKSECKRCDRGVKWIINGFILFYVITIGSSPWTHWVAYFDENLVYQHGPVMFLLYVLPFVLFIWEVMLFLNAREKFNRYQFLSSVGIILSMVISVTVTIFFPKMLVGQFCMALIMFFIYVTFENPAYYTYHDTQCLNRNAFFEDLPYHHDNDMIIIEFSDFDYIEQNNEFDVMDMYRKKIADTLHSFFGQNVYNVTDSTYVLLTKSKDKSAFSKSTELIMQLHDNHIQIMDHSQQFKINLYYIKNIDYYSPKDIELFTQYLKENIYTKDEGIQKLNEIRSRINRQNDVLHAIRNALENDKFEIYYQPIFDVQNGTYHCAEALIRLFDDQLGFINPEEMIIIAEQNGYIDQIGNVVFEKVCKCIHDNNLKEKGIKYIEINLSPKQCLRMDIVPCYMEIMRKYQILPKQINLEVTETAEFGFNRQVMENLHYFANLGIDIALDDYGSGYACPNYLIQIPFTHVKIDKQILWSALEDKKALIILKNIITMLHSLEKKIIVEGVENEKMIRLLDSENCEYYQGYFYSKPIPEKDFVAFIANQNK